MVFFSYARSDGDRPESDRSMALARELRTAGVDLWADDRIRLGQSFRAAIDEALGRCQMMLVILTPRAVASQEVESEWTAALARDKPVIPVLLERCDIPSRLSTLNRVDLTRDYHGQFAALLACIGAEPSRAPATDASVSDTPELGVRPAGEVTRTGSPRSNASATDLGHLIANGITSDGSLRLDVIAYTGETLVDPVHKLRVALLNRESCLRHLDLRLLVWDCGGRPVLPRNARTGDPEATYLRSMRQRRHYPGSKINQTLEEIEALGVSVHRSLRFSPLEPSVKALIIRDVAVYWTLYSIRRHRHTFDARLDDDVWDYGGFGLPLTKALPGTAAYDAVTAWFGSVWDVLSTERPRPR